MEEVLEETPELLPVLKEAGVVDSGGQGLLEICIGFHNFITNKEIIDDSEIETTLPKVNIPKHAEDVDIKFAYCTEFIINVEGNFKKRKKIVWNHI